MDENFKDLMRAYRSEKAPDDFTSVVMNRIFATQPLPEYKPVLNKWFLRGVYAAFGIFLGYAIFFSQPSTGKSGEVASLWDKMTGYLPTIQFSAENHLLAGLGNISPIVGAIFISAALLLMIDQLVMKSKKIRN